MVILDARTLRDEEIAASIAARTQAGGVVVLPTDTVYGIFCDPARPLAIERIYALKDRPRSKPLALHVGDIETYLAFAGDNVAAVRLGRAFLPGALTVIVARPPNVDARVAAGFDSIGLRVPGHDLCRTILRSTGPLAGTSANLSGRPAFTGGAIPADFPEADALVADGLTQLETESTIIDVSQARPRLIRAGAIAPADLERCLGIELR